MALEIRAIGPDELDDLIQLDFRAFGGAPTTDGPRTWASGELERTRVAFEDGQMVGASRAYSFELTLPGGAIVPAAAVSWVGVLPTHRRRGVLTQMIGALHDDARERGEPAAILTASESAIYGRFGYGVATWRQGITVDRARVRFAQPFTDPGRMRIVAREEAEKIVPTIYDAARRRRAGMVSRPDFWWPEVMWSEHGKPEKALFAVVHEDADGVPDGYADYEITGSWSAGHADRTAAIYDLQSTNDVARIALWQYLLSIDLVKQVTAYNVAVDEPVRHLLNDGRHARVDYVIDGLWLAPLDPSALLAARRYSFFDGHLVLEVTAPDGTSARYAIDGNDRDAQCRVTDEAPDLTLSTSVLGATVLGGNRFTDYANAGLVTAHRAGKLAYADAMFSTSPAPTLMTGF
jgi:predicted acetyltransferase